MTLGLSARSATMNASCITTCGGRAHRPRAAAIGLWAWATACGLLLGSWPAIAQDPPPAPAPAGNGNEQVLTRGPIHEAFAAPVVHDPRSGPVIPKQPPRAHRGDAAGPEAFRPERAVDSRLLELGPGTHRLPLDQRSLRKPPPGRQWVPGYWHQVEGGFQSGFPATGCPSACLPAAEQARRRHRLNPPTCQLRRRVSKRGPAAPRRDLASSGRREAGTGKGNAMSVPGLLGRRPVNLGLGSPHYVYTPGGYLFVEGYWDLPLANRGLIFAPVYYPQPVYLRPAYVFTPSITIATPGLVANLFVQPAYGCYCFGDYYAQSYVAAGIYPWFSFSYVSGPARPVFYDPVFTFYATINVTRDPGWVTRIRREYIVRRDNVAMRPPRTLIEQTRIVERGGGRGIVTTRSIQEIARHPAAAGGMRLAPERHVATTMARARRPARSVPRAANAA